MKKDKSVIVIFLTMFAVVFSCIAIYVMDSISKRQQIEQLQSSVIYLSDRCNELQKQSEQQQRQINQDFKILTEGWKE